jgi:lipopolysaccharide transport system permease protein
MAMSTTETAIPVKRPKFILEPSKGWSSLGLHEIWEYKELLYFLVWRDVKVRYKQTALGAAWAVIQPVFTMLVFSLFFGKLGKIPSDEFHIPCFHMLLCYPGIFLLNH